MVTNKVEVNEMKKEEEKTQKIDLDVNEWDDDLLIFDQSEQIKRENLRKEWDNIRFYFKVFRFDLNDEENHLSINQSDYRQPKIEVIYKKAFKFLRKSIKREFQSCVVTNLQHKFIQCKRSEFIYIIFQMTIQKQT